MEGGLEGVPVGFLAKLYDWKAKRAEEERRIIAEALADAQDAPVINYSEFTNAQAAARADRSSSPKKRGGYDAQPGSVWLCARGDQAAAGGNGAGRAQSVHCPHA
ncbi:hypothetical protein FZ934_05455 [Rhizobium grahamii]|uniref:Uncharacterized protein n=1 Tax=Rhizobium grahamii TaxID=1120045 RepID=A0A5Q0C222_9HYPH|nr:MULTISPECIES: hypothetical protein [Rhizobium]QFY59928.1 hypothetical protein FZ934_05455 [Rhizobium grahamii]QRM50955.1 hypothetical protein F3Y33_17440 [Rhizobium sp. BG6]